MWGGVMALLQLDRMRSDGIHGAPVEGGKIKKSAQVTKDAHCPSHALLASMNHPSTPTATTPHLQGTAGAQGDGGVLRL
jgi:hypothetical protein